MTTVKTNPKDARLAGLVIHHVEMQKDQIREAIQGAPVGTFAVTITEHTPMRWRAACEMVQAGELVVLSEARCATRRGPPAANGKRRERREMRVTLAGWDPVSREFKQEVEDL